MNETEPKYFIEFRREFGEFKRHIDDKFEETNKNIDISIDELAISIEHQFEEQEENLKEYMHENFATKLDLERFATKLDLERFATKLDLYEVETKLGNRLDNIDDKLEKIEGHIGRYEIRAQNLEQILLKDHKPRIEALELASII